MIGYRYSRYQGQYGLADSVNQVYPHVPYFLELHRAYNFLDKGRQLYILLIYG